MKISDLTDLLRGGSATADKLRLARDRLAAEVVSLEGTCGRGPSDEELLASDADALKAIRTHGEAGEKLALARGRLEAIERLIVKAAQDEDAARMKANHAQALQAQAAILQAATAWDKLAADGARVLAKIAESAKAIERFNNSIFDRPDEADLRVDIPANLESDASLTGIAVLPRFDYGGPFSGSGVKFWPPGSTATAEDPAQ